MNMSLRQMTIGVIDDHCVVREGILNILNRNGGVSVVFEGATADDALRLCKEHEPKLLLIDLGIPGSGLAALRVLREQYPEMICVIFTSCDDPIVAMEALSIGVAGYILKGIGGNDLYAALTGIVAGSTFVSPDFAMRLMTAASQSKQKDDSKQVLNHREEQVMKGVENGLTNRQIAERLKLSEQTVKYYMTAIMQKYGVQNRVSALREYHSH